MKWKAPHEWEQLKQGIDCPICVDMHLEENRLSFKVAELQLCAWDIEPVSLDAAPARLPDTLDDPRGQARIGE